MKTDRLEDSNFVNSHNRPLDAMFGHLLSLRLKILVRMLRTLGWVRLALLLGSVLAAMWYLAQFVTTGFQALLLAGFTVSVLGSVHLSRMDGRFLKTLGAPAWIVYSTEYIAYASPVILVLLVVGRPMAVVAVVVGCLTLPVFGLDGGRRLEKRRRSSRILRRSFEWIAGARKTMPFIVLVYLAGLMFARNPSSVPIALVALSTLVTTYFHIGEGRPMMETFRLAPGAFLYDKVVQTLAIFWTCCAPLALVFLMLHAEHWLILVVVAAGCTILLVTAVLAKYTFYAEGERFSNPHMVVTTVSLSSMLLFVSSFVAVGLVFWLYFRAVANLRIYLEPESK